MTWNWRFEKSDGSPVSSDEVPGGQSTFPAQGEAESWVGEVWRELVASGVDAVTLLEGDRVVYGPMSLHPTADS